MDAGRAVAAEARVRTLAGMGTATPLRYLSASDVLDALPAVDERLRLAERAMASLGVSAELPPKIGVQPREPGSLAHAMPALLRDPGSDPANDLLGMKWVVGFPSNVAAGLPAIHGSVILNDGATGLPRAILDAGILTAHRTAAVSGLAMARWGPPRGARVSVTIVGAGAQARSHLPVVAHLWPEAEVVVCDRDRDRLDALVRDVRMGTPVLGAFPAIRVADDPVEAAASSDVVLTMVSFGPQHQLFPPEAFGTDATIVAVDYDMCVPASVAAEAALFLVDDREQYLANHGGAAFAGYPTEVTTIGEAIRGPVNRPRGRVVVTHLGVGIADLVFADAVLRNAEDRRLGTILPR
jgi:alanine dehydrogenase